MVIKVQTFAFLLKMWGLEGGFSQNLRKSYKLCGVDYMMFRLGSRTSARRETVGYAQMQNYASFGRSKGYPQPQWSFKVLGAGFALPFG